MAEKTDIHPTIDTSGLSQEQYDRLTEDEIIVISQLRQILSSDAERLGAPKITSHDRTPQPAKNIYEVFELIQWSIEKHWQEEGRPTRNSPIFTYEEPDSNSVLPCISAHIVRREPGSYSRGAPFEGRTKNRRPMIREIVDDEDNTNYKKVILGYWFDNIITLTAWARTNKEANDLAFWLEKHMFDYTWVFRSCGTNKILYDGRDREIAKKVDNNMIYGRPIRYFVRTELITTMNERKLSKIIMSVISAQDSEINQ